MQSARRGRVSIYGADHEATLLLVPCLLSSTVMAETTTFETQVIGQPPAGWTCGATGRGSPKWSVEADKSSPGAGKVLHQSGVAAFPWCIKGNTKLADGWVEVKFKPLAAEKTRPAGWSGAGGTATTTTWRAPTPREQRLALLHRTRQSARH
jgi:hypothetical protein